MNEVPKPKKKGKGNASLLGPPSLSTHPSGTDPITKSTDADASLLGPPSLSTPNLSGTDPIARSTDANA